MILLGIVLTFSFSLSLPPSTIEKSLFQERRSSFILRGVFMWNILNILNFLFVRLNYYRLKSLPSFTAVLLMNHLLYEKEYF